ncbi:MarR family winged helix-turn-helix transcriptional regulator [Nakamurella lactea]|uniref:MarR family winged helix-turn-helix transcriptional regulator n=1 Tax=Nakamurella lactea TaxID=459515 RepID=UPI000400D317|nr:MarR family winged helix-turn-helix transcriptional regulator [Nakamurella lactea]
MNQPTAGFELPILLLAGFRSLIDDLHAELARQGHPEARPVHGFALQAVAAGASTAAELGRAMGVSKQAAGKTIERLESIGYLSRTADDADARRRTAVLTDAGWDMLRRSAEVFDDLRSRWQRQLGGTRLPELERSLREVVGPAALRLDSAGWFGTP